MPFSRVAGFIASVAVVETQTVRAGDVELVVREWGEPTGRPLVFWHGLNPFGALALNEAGPAWAAAGFRVVAPAAPGCGDSASLPTAEQYLPSRLAALVLDLASALDVARFAFVGWSWGATVGVHLAATGAPLDALVLVDAGHTDVVVEAVRRFAELLPRADMRTLRGGHDLLADAPAETIAIVAEFVGSTPRRV